MKRLLCQKIDALEWKIKNLEARIAHLEMAQTGVIGFPDLPGTSTGATTANSSFKLLGQKSMTKKKLRKAVGL